MSVILPVTEYMSAQPGILDWGGSLIPALGGPEQRVNRLGTRSTLTVTVEPDPDDEAAGRILLQRLRQGKNEGVMMPWPQSGVPVGMPGAPLVDGAVAGGTTIPVKGLTAQYAVRIGMPFSIIIGGRRYLHFVDDQVIASAGGNVSLVVSPMLRKPLAGDEVIELEKPMIEGALEFEQWNIAAAGNEPFSFTIREMA